MAMPKQTVAPGEGERSAQRGYTSQYGLAAAAIYASLRKDDLEWIGLADRGAGIADDVVLGHPTHVVGHQFKISRFPSPFRVQTCLIGADGLLKPLVEAWQTLKCTHPDRVVEIRLVTNDYPSTSDKLSDDSRSHSAAFVLEYELNPGRSLAQWRASKWGIFIDKLLPESGLDEPHFDEFLRSLRILCGPAADFAQANRLSSGDARLVDEITAILPRMVADARDKDRWTRAELLQELGWRDSASTHHIHRFPVGVYVQSNPQTERALREAIQRNTGGYLSLVGPPGAGKSTLLQASLESEPDMYLVRYLAFVPDVGQGVGRGEADDFFDDIVTQIKRTGLRGMRPRDDSLQERREQFSALLREAGERYASDGIRTLFVIDGLDHVPREERPHRSFLAELPNPAAVPDGVLFVLGTQTVQLDDIKPAVRDQAGAVGRRIEVAPLAREAVHRVADLLGLDAGIDRDCVFKVSLGHPLVTRYLIEALRDADETTRDTLLSDAMTFDGDIETVYESAWRDIQEDEQAQAVLDYLARAEGAMPLELLAQAIPEQAIERALSATRHLLAEGQHGWRVFHNSFRLFLLGKPRMRLGKPDPSYDTHVYQNLASLARMAPDVSPQRWLELRYLARGEDHASVLALATPTRFREQFADRRPVAELHRDLRLAFASARQCYDPLKVFQLLLIQDEMDRRWSAYEYASAIVEALLAVGDLDGAVAFVDHFPDQGYDVVDALLEVGDIPGARALFDQLEPLQQLQTAMSKGYSSDASELFEWAQRAVHFRDRDQIFRAIDRLTKVDREQGSDVGEEDADQLAQELRSEVAKAVIMGQEDADIAEVGQTFGVTTSAQVALLVEAGIVSADRGSVDQALAQFREAVSKPEFPQVVNATRRTAALIAARNGGVSLAEHIADGLQVPAIADLDEISYQDRNDTEHVACAILEHAELAAILDRPVAAAPRSNLRQLRPLQLHCETIGNLLGSFRREPSLVPDGDVVRAVRAVLTYFRHVCYESGEFQAQRVISLALPVLGAALVQVATLCGEQALAATITEFERFFSESSDINEVRSNLRRAVAVELYRQTGDGDMASRLLESTVDALPERTPVEQIDELSKLAVTFSRVGNVGRARTLLARLPQETLGYELPAKKDPQYILWRELLERANQADPDRRCARVALLLRQITGMALTAGDDAARRIAASLLKEAAMCDGQTGWRAGRLLVDEGLIGWARLVDALLCGLVRRRSDLAPVAAVSWSELALPHYMEPYYSEAALGEFIETTIGAAAPTEALAIVECLLDSIEAESRAHERAVLLGRLCHVANAHGICSRRMEDALQRWRLEAPPPRHTSTPGPYDDVSSLEELTARLEQDAKSREPGYEAAQAFRRLAPNSDFTLAIEVFDRWGTIQRDSRARFTVVDLAIDSGRTDLARQLMEDDLQKNDDPATWAEWTGGRSLRHYKARVRLDGESVRSEAYEDFVGSLATGQESITSVLVEHDEIFATITDEPDWAGMWDALAEQLTTTREYALGAEFADGDVSTLDDEALIVELYAWALSLPLDELRRHVFTGALRLVETAGGRPVFVQLIRHLLDGTEERPADGLQLLLLDPSDCAAVELARELLKLANHADYAVAELATALAGRWGHSTSRATEALPPFYTFVLDDDDDFERSELVDPASGSMVVEDVAGWIHGFDDQVRLLTGSGATAAHIRQRCRMFIERWGGLSKFGKTATRELVAELRRLDLRMTYFRPHAAVAARALRYVAGELRRADLIPEMATRYLLHEMGYPAPRPPLIRPVPRPAFVRRPALDKPSWESIDDDWLNGAEDDTNPLETAAETIVAEVCEFHIRDFRRSLHTRRVRAPALGQDDGGRDFEGFDLLPGAIWLGQVYPLTEDPARTIARRLQVSHVPEVPRFQLIICPFWLSRLGWRPHPDNPLVFQDTGGSRVARIVWWRDGGPVDQEEDVIWGQGMYLSLTPAGRMQLEALIGPLDVKVYVRRSRGREYSGEAEESRLAIAGG